MFNQGDNVFVLDSGSRNGDTLKVIQRTFNGYTSQEKTHVSLSGKTSLKVQVWATFPSATLATQFGIAYLINTKEFGKTINNNTNISNLYAELEEKHPELIMKYMEKVVEE